MVSQVLTICLARFTPIKPAPKVSTFVSLCSRLFTADEVAYALARPLPAQHLAARLAAKEAAFKALSGNSLARGIGWKEIEVVRGDEHPTLTLHGRAADRAAELGVTSIWVSLTHSATTAGAVVVLESARSSNSVQRTD